ncbi:MAG: DUF4384 domain-containing protein [Hyphomicrobiaceae bacterium]|nr:MAG: DUF4384 domain-containing protein [Hyphomicrobiaceae bacterium]
MPGRREGLRRMWTSRVERRQRAPSMAPALLAAALLCSGVAAPGLSAEAPPVPPAPLDPKALAVYKVLESHCARCHQAGLLKRQRPAADLANALDLQEIASDPHLVKPGNPDASRLYLKMLAREMPFDILQENVPGERPTPTEIAAVRAWIAALPRPSASLCASPPGRLTDRQVALAMAADLAQAGPQQAADYRYLTIAHLAPSCGDKERLAALGAGVEALINAWNRTPRVARLAPIDPAATLFRVRLSQIGWPVETWEAVASLSPYRAESAGAGLERLRALTRSNTPIVRADWLAFLLSEETFGRLAAIPAASAVNAALAALQTQPSELQQAAGNEDRFHDLLKAAGVNSGLRIEGLAPARALARLYRKDVTLEAAAAELGTDASEIMRRIEGAPAEIAFLLRRLEQTGLSRKEFEIAYDQLILASRTADAAPGTVSLGIKDLEALTAESTRPFALDLAAARAVANSKDVVRLTARSERDCHLSIINVDSTGNATVLLPNDFDRDTRLLKGRLLEFPRRGAPFRFRLGKPGFETFIAICNASGPITDVIRQDFNLQKFTDLGPYEAYLERWLKGETAETKTVTTRRKVPRRRTRERPEPVAVQAAPQRPSIARRAVQVEVRPR